MALKIYADLLNEIKQYCSIADTTSFNAFGGTIDTVVTMAENRIFRELRCREMEQTITTSNTISGGVVSLPSDFIELKYAYLNNEQPYKFLTRRTASWIYERFPYRAASSQPTHIAREGSSWIFGPYPDTSRTYTLKGYYWGRPVTMIGVTATASANAVFAAHPDLYIAASIRATRPYLKGIDAEGAAIWEAEYQSIKMAIMNEARAEDYEGSEIIGDE